MPGLFTAQQLCDLVRDEAQEWDTSIVFDGFATGGAYGDDAQFPKGTRILPLLNQALRNYVNKTGFNKCYFNLPVTSGKREYLVHRGMGRVESAWLVDPTSSKQFFIERTTVNDLDKLYYQTWRNRSGNRPLGYYFIGTRAVGFDVEPTQAWTLRFLADSQVNDLVLVTDIPGQIVNSSSVIVLATDGSAESCLPEFFQDGLAYYAAGVLCARGNKQEESKRLFGLYEDRLAGLKEFVNARVYTEKSHLGVSRSGRYSNDGSLYRKL